MLGLPISVVYRAYCVLFLSLELPVQTIVGARLRIHHGIGLVIHGDSVIGDDVVLRQNTTIGERKEGSRCPRIGNNVNVGAGVSILGDVSIGDGATIGAGSIVVKNVESLQTVKGQYAR